MSDKTTPRCQAEVLKRDDYRVSRTGGAKFKVHYTKHQCSRKAMVGDLCRQHGQPGAYVKRCAFAQEFMDAQP